MQYMMLIYSDEKNSDYQPGGPNFEAMMGGYMAFTKEVREAGVMVAGDPLQDSHTATTVSVRDGKAQITDGPFAETKEQLGGYYILDCKNLDEALGYAAKIPSAAYGRVEVRPIMDFDN